MNIHVKIFFSVVLLIVAAACALPVWFPSWFAPREERVIPFDPNDPRMPPAWRAYMEQVDE